MAGWDSENGTSVSATERLRLALLRRRRRPSALPEAPLPEQMPEERLGHLTDYTGTDPAAGTLEPTG
jgi:hypothetical protein